MSLFGVLASYLIIKKKRRKIDGFVGRSVFVDNCSLPAVFPNV
jgi:hypothetical protein